MADATPSRPLAPEGSATSSSASLARAVIAVTLHRATATPSLEIATGGGVRYLLAAAPGGIQLLAHAPPDLERVARADLHAIAETLRRRGTPLARAAVAAPIPGRRQRAEPGAGPAPGGAPR